jgi:stage V sporulation protein SpoVS
MTKAEAALAQEDLLQASEKGWGAAAQMVKAIADQRGWIHNGHAPLFQAIRRLVEETGDEQIGVLFHVANALHINFYENVMGGELVAVGLSDIRQLVSRLEQLLI